MLCMGERTKGGRYKPSIKTIRYSQITGALKGIFRNEDIHAVGHLVNYKVDYLVYSLKDRASDKAKIPLRIEFLTNVCGVVYLLKDKPLSDSQKSLKITMGALVSKGFGECSLEWVGEVDLETQPTKPGFLITRIPVNAMDGEFEYLQRDGKPTRFLAEKFGIKKIINPRYGYLFEPFYEENSPLSYTGHYVLSIFEESKIEGPEFLVKKEDDDMDVIERLLDEVKNDKKVQECRYFSSNFLNNVADVFEKHGFGTTKTFLWEKQSRGNLKYQATALLSVLEKLEECEQIKQNRSLGRYIIKTLITIKSKEV